MDEQVEDNIMVQQLLHSSVSDSAITSEFEEESQSEYDPNQFIVDENVSLHTTVSYIGSKPSTPTSLFCRICHERNLQEERNISPCECRGTLSMVHRSCLETWLAASESNHCELCGHRFQVKRIPKYSLLKSIWNWYFKSGSLEERRSIIKSTISLLVEAPIALGVNYIWFTRADELLDYMDSIADEYLPFYEGQDLFNGWLKVVSQAFNIAILSPIGILSGAYLMIFFFKLIDYTRKWYFWHKGQSILILQLPEQSINE